MGMFEGRNTNEEYIQKYLQDEGLEEHEAERVVNYGLESGSMSIASEAVLNLDDIEFDNVNELLTYVEEETQAKRVPKDEYAIDFDRVGSTDGK